jgi:alpha-methylacyl-CoA racemase
MGLTGPEWDQRSRDTWPHQRELLEAAFRSKTRDEWCALLEGTDCCFAPVLTPEEARTHPHNVARGMFVKGYPAPAPRLCGAGESVTSASPVAGADTDTILRELGFNPEDFDQ